MDRIDEYLQESITKMFDIYTSSVLEACKKQKEYVKADMIRNDFFRYLKDEYPDFDKKEFTEAKSKEAATAVVNKYRDDFERFLKKQPKRYIPTFIHWGVLAADFAGIIPSDVANKLYKILLADDIIYYGKEINKGIKNKRRK